MADSYPMIVDKTYKPRIGDKLELIHSDGTTVIGVVADIVNNYAYTENGTILYANSWFYKEYSRYAEKPDSIRLLHRKPIIKSSISVGDVIDASMLDELPYGSIITSVDSNLHIAIVKEEISRYKYQNISSHRAWSVLRNGRFLVEFIPNWG